MGPVSLCSFPSQIWTVLRQAHPSSPRTPCTLAGVLQAGASALLCATCRRPASTAAGTDLGRPHFLLAKAYVALPVQGCSQPRHHGETWQPWRKGEGRGKPGEGPGHSLPSEAQGAC